MKHKTTNALTRLAAVLAIAALDAFAEEKRIVISIPDRRLVLLDGKRILKIYPIAVGKPSTPSPQGEFHVINRIPNPTWYGPGQVVGPGKNNPLGTRWMGLSERGYGIHGTNAPRSIGKAASHGCIRMRARDLEELFVRVVVATHRNLEEQVRNGAFRQDLYHRIYVFPITLPPLRERRGDIAVLVEHFGRRVCEVNGWKPKAFTAGAVEALERYAWPGNVRELRNAVERLLLLSDIEVNEETVRAALPASARAAVSGTLAVRVEAFERETIRTELDRSRHNMTEAARGLGLERSHLYKKCAQLGIDVKGLRRGEE